MKQNVKKEFVDRQVSKAFKRGDYGALLNRHKKIINLVLKYSKKEDYILDVGCSDGKILKTLDQNGYQNLYGVDFSNASKKIYTDSSIHFAQCDVEKDRIPFKEKFDVVIFSDVLEHFFSPQAVLFDLKENLSKDASVILSVPNAGWFLNGFLLSVLPSKLFLSTAFGPWGHTYQFTFYQTKKIAHNLKFIMVELSGGQMDNYAFGQGVKKLLYESFLSMLNPLALLYPQLFSAHIFAVLQNTTSKLAAKNRFEYEN